MGVNIKYCKGKPIYFKTMTSKITSIYDLDNKAIDSPDPQPTPSTLPSCTKYQWEMKAPCEQTATKLNGYHSALLLEICLEGTHSVRIHSSIRHNTSYTENNAQD